MTEIKDRQPNSLKKALGIAGGTLSVLVTLYLLFSSVVLLFFPTQAVNVLGYRFYIISYTRSMEPELQYRDLIVVQKYEFSKLTVGDYITFEGRFEHTEQTVPITHEIIEIVTDNSGKTLLKTKGKNAPTFDITPVTEDGADGTNRYIGKYAMKSTFFGYFFTFCQSPQGIITLSVNFAALVGIYLLTKDYLKRKRTDTNTEAIPEHAAIAGMIENDPTLQNAIMTAIAANHDALVVSNVDIENHEDEQDLATRVACDQTLERHGDGEVIANIVLTDTVVTDGVATEQPVASLEIIKIDDPSDNAK